MGCFSHQHPDHVINIPNSSSSPRIHPTTQTSLLNFNLNNYPGVDSAIFVVHNVYVIGKIPQITNLRKLFSSDADFFIELYDSVGKISIGNSLVSTASLPEERYSIVGGQRIGATLYSDNIVDGLRSGTMDLTVRYWVEPDTIQVPDSIPVSAVGPYPATAQWNETQLILYRSK